MEKIDSKLLSGSGLNIQNNFLFPNIRKTVFGQINVFETKQTHR
jgi:hypothetical protein